MSREQYEKQFDSLSKAFSRSRRRSSAGAGAASGDMNNGSGAGKTKDEMAHFVGMLMDLVGVFNKEDKMLDKSLSLDDPRMTFSMIFGGGKGINMTGEEEEWSTDDDEAGTSETEEPSSSLNAVAMLDEGIKLAAKARTKAPLAPVAPSLPAEGRKVTEAEAEATADELAAAESAREKRKLKNAKKKADKKKKLKEKKEMERVLKAGMHMAAGGDPGALLHSERDDVKDDDDDDDDDEVMLLQLKQAFIATATKLQQHKAVNTATAASSSTQGARSTSSSASAVPMRLARPDQSPGGSGKNSSSNSGSATPAVPADAAEDFITVGKKTKKSPAKFAGGSPMLAPMPSKTSPAPASTPVTVAVPAAAQTAVQFKPTASSAALKLVLRPPTRNLSASSDSVPTPQQHQQQQPHQKQQPLLVQQKQQPLLVQGKATVQRERANSTPQSSSSAHSPSNDLNSPIPAFSPPRFKMSPYPGSNSTAAPPSSSSDSANGSANLPKSPSPSSGYIGSNGIIGSSSGGNNVIDSCANGFALRNTALQGAPSNGSINSSSSSLMSDSVLAGLMAMGFAQTDCLRAMELCGRDNVDALVSFLVEGPQAVQGVAVTMAVAKRPSGGTASTAPATGTVNVETDIAQSQPSLQQLEIDRREEMRRINREWNQKTEDEKRKAEMERRTREAQKQEEVILQQNAARQSQEQEQQQAAQHALYQQRQEYYQFYQAHIAYNPRGMPFQQLPPHVLHMQMQHQHQQQQQQQQQQQHLLLLLHRQQQQRGLQHEHTLAQSVIREEEFPALGSDPKLDFPPHGKTGQQQQDREKELQQHQQQQQLEEESIFGDAAGYDNGPVYSATGAVELSAGARPFIPQFGSSKLPQTALHGMQGEQGMVSIGSIGNIVSIGDMGNVGSGGVAGSSGGLGGGAMTMGMSMGMVSSPWAASSSSATPLSGQTSYALPLPLIPIMSSGLPGQFLPGGGFDDASLMGLGGRGPPYLHGLPDLDAGDGGIDDALLGATFFNGFDRLTLDEDTLALDTSSESLNHMLGGVIDSPINSPQRNNHNDS